MSIYYLSRDYKYKRLNDAGNKARLDIEQTMDKIGFLPIGKRRTISKNKILHFFRTLAFVFLIPFKIHKKDILIIQYPTKYYDTICRLTHLCGARIITLIHDLGCFRQKHNSIKKEIRRLNRTDALISHNSNYSNWIVNNGFVGHNKKSIIISLQVFDFLSDAQSPNRKATWPMNKIVYAGQLALRKNRFLYNWGNYAEIYKINVYGKGFDQSCASCSDKFETKGFTPPEKLISDSEGDFGLVWDGDSIDCCSGDWGEYLKLNAPHKVSLYIRCGLPILIWREAAMAEFIEKNNIGICIDSLRDINNIYKNLSQKEYNAMCNNVQRVSQLMAEGNYFCKAATEAISQLNKL